MSGKLDSFRVRVQYGDLEGDQPYRVANGISDWRGLLVRHSGEPSAINGITGNAGAPWAGDHYRRESGF